MALVDTAKKIDKARGKLGLPDDEQILVACMANPRATVGAMAAGGIAGANPFRTGLTAFKLGNAKVMVPMVFVYSPAMLIVLDDYFTWSEFLLTTLTCIIGIVMLGAALTGFIVRPMGWVWRWLLAIASIAMVAPDPEANLWALALALPVLLSQFVPWWRERKATPTAT